MSTFGVIVIRLLVYLLLLLHVSLSLIYDVITVINVSAH